VTGLAAFYGLIIFNEHVKPILTDGTEKLKTYKHILSFTLITALLFSGLPMFQGEDASRDSSVDLKDVILLVKVFEGTAENRTDFRESIQNMVSALQVTAGMKTVIKSSDESRTGSSFAGLDLTFLKSVSALATEVGNSFYLNERAICFESVTTTPSSPPPKFSLDELIHL
jgi:hypothetical protein